MSHNVFFTDMAPYAKQASAATGVPVSVILAQWGLESGYGTSRFAREGLNFGGIKLSPNSPTKNYMVQGGTGAKFAKYNSISQFVQDYIRVLKLPYYDDVRQTITNNPVEEAIADLAASPYDAGHYGGSGQGLLSIIANYDLRRFDAGKAVSGLISPVTVKDGKAIMDVAGLDDSRIAWGLVAVAALIMAYGLAAVAGGEAD